MAKLFGAIILNWNGLELLKEFIPAAYENTVSDASDLIVADNGSDDESLNWLKQNYPRVKTISFQKNYGFAEGYNRAIEICKDYDYVCLLNSDVLVGAGWWQPLVDYMRHHPETGAVQPKIKSYKNREFFEYAGAAGGLIDRMGFPYCRGRLFDIIEKDNGQYDGETADIAWASGACLVTKPEIYLNAGGLDTSFFAHQEEIDLCIRIRLNGKAIRFVPDSEVWHVGGASLSSGSPRKTYLNFRNNLLLIYKNSKKNKAKRRTIIRRLIDTLALLAYLAKGDIKNAKAIFEAHRDYALMSKNYAEKHPASDILPNLPGADKYALLQRLKLLITHPEK